MFYFKWGILLQNLNCKDNKCDKDLRAEESSLMYLFFEIIYSSSSDYDTEPRPINQDSENKTQETRLT